MAESNFEQNLSNKQFNLPCRYEHCLAGVKTGNFSLSFRSVNDNCQQPESICDNKHQKIPLGSFLKTYHEELQEMQKKDLRPYLLTPGRCTESWGFNLLVVVA